ncbi:MAG: DoxX family protein [Candidatus Paceibacterota bacterium]
MKKAKILFWVSTSLIFLFEGVMSAVSSHSEMSIAGITGLGYPLYFVTIIAAFKVVGSLVLIIPSVPSRIKEWAYAGFGIDFICAFISLWVVTGFNVGLLFPVVAMIVLIISYVNYHKIK